MERELEEDIRKIVISTNTVQTRSSRQFLVEAFLSADSLVNGTFELQRIEILLRRKSKNREKRKKKKKKILSFLPTPTSFLLCYAEYYGLSSTATLPLHSERNARGARNTTTNNHHHHQQQQH